MPKYNLDALGSEEFEHLCQALVLEIIGHGAKVYGMGKDGAREATFHGKAPYPSATEQWDGDWIFQAKFHNIQQIGPKESRMALLAELDDELSKITEKYEHPCDNYILMTNVSLTPVFQKGTKDTIDNEIIPKYQPRIKHIHVLGAEEICRHLDSHTGVRQTYLQFLVSGDIIARLLEMLEQEKTDLDELVKLYCQGCFDHEQYALLDDAGDVEDDRISLQRIFIDLDVEPPTLSQEQQVSERLPEWLKQAAEDESRNSALSYLLDDYIPGLVLIGGPGSGKSTLGQYLAQIYRARLVGRLNDLCQYGVSIGQYENCIPRIPFRVLLREYAQWISSRRQQKEPDSLFHYIALQVSQESGRDSDSEDIQNIVKSNPVLLILDGLDEVSEKALRRKVVDNITSFVDQVRVLEGNLRVIATTRPYGYSDEFDPSHCLHLTLKKLGLDRASDYAQRWSNARESSPREAGKIRDAFNMCLEDRVVSVLTQTPLQVTILLVIIRARGTPPKQREELFERYMDIIYQREQKNRPELLRTEQDMIYGLHKYLAYVLHRRAEKDKTAALMDMSEFQQRVKEYLDHSDPVITEEEIEIKTNQIIKEASQRLVLIESPQQERVGFGLTTIREFFAAAHLVDIAKDTKQRDERFKAIARSPHWRNVALFFAGRVGRRLPGEAPSMIDVCREIDTEEADRFLKRGARLVKGMLEDRVLRERYNEVGALQYALGVLDTEFVAELANWIQILKELPEEYKERVVHPWFEEKLRSVIPEELGLYTAVYRKLFPLREPLENAIKRASSCKSQDIKLWALSQAIREGIVEPWVMQLFEASTAHLPTDQIVRTLADHWSMLLRYLDIPFSSRVRAIIACSLLNWISEGSPRYEPSGPEVMEEIGKIKANNNENYLFMWPVAQLAEVANTTTLTTLPEEMDISVEFLLPGIAHPCLSKWVDSNANVVETFCRTFSKESDAFTRSFVDMFRFLSTPDDFDNFAELSRILGQENVASGIRKISSKIFGSLIFGLYHETEDRLREYHEEFCNLYKLYESEDEYKRDTEEINELMNRQSANLPNHAYRILLWIEAGCPPSIESFLDSELLNDLKAWFSYRGLPTHVVSYFPWSAKLKEELHSDLELCEMGLEVVQERLEKKKPLSTTIEIGLYLWHRTHEEPELTVARRLRQVLEGILEDYPNLKDAGHQALANIYWVALDAGIMEEELMSKLCGTVNELVDFPRTFWYAEEHKNIAPKLVKMLRSNNLKVARLAAVSLSAYVTYSQNRRGVTGSMWIGGKFWELARDPGDPWNSRYLEGMSACTLRWSKYRKEWLEAIKSCDSEESENAWRRVIHSGGCSGTRNYKALYDLLIQILDLGDDCAKSIRSAAFNRLNEIIYQVESQEFDEASLGLPLSRRH